MRVAGGTETPIAGATSETYTLTADDVGSQLKVVVTFTDDSGNLERVESALTAVVVADDLRDKRELYLRHLRGLSLPPARARLFQKIAIGIRGILRDAGSVRERFGARVRRNQVDRAAPRPARSGFPLYRYALGGPHF